MTERRDSNQCSEKNGKLIIVAWPADYARNLHQSNLNMIHAMRFSATQTFRG